MKQALELKQWQAAVFKEKKPDKEKNKNMKLILNYNLILLWIVHLLRTKSATSHSYYNSLHIISGSIFHLDLLRNLLQCFQSTL